MIQSKEMRLWQQQQHWKHDRMRVISKYTKIVYRPEKSSEDVDTTGR
jgi:hypothetical protein